MFWFVCFWEDTSIFHKLAGPGHRLLYLRENYMLEMQIFFFVAILLHFAEAGYAHMICKEMNLVDEIRMKWIGQTLMVGYSSLRHLTKFKSKIEEEKKKKEKSSTTKKVD